MMKTLTVSAAAVLMGLTAVPVAACQGPQFESSLVLFSEAAKDDVPDGMVQLRVRITDYSLRNVYDRDLISVYAVDFETGERLPKDARPRNVSIVKPVGTSCDNVTIPKAGEYFVTGRLALNENGGPVLINGSQLFFPEYDRRKSYPDFGSLEVDPQS